MLQGKCHCGAVSWTLDATPMSVTACNCTICRRYGALWAYGTVGHDILIAGRTRAYRRGDSGDIDFHFCGDCGCVTHYVADPGGQGEHKRGAVNVRMAEPSPISAIPIRHFDGHGSFKSLPADGRTVRDMWF